MYVNERMCVINRLAMYRMNIHQAYLTVYMMILCNSLLFLLFIRTTQLQSLLLTSSLSVHDFKQFLLSLSSHSKSIFCFESRYSSLVFPFSPSSLFLRIVSLHMNLSFLIQNSCVFKPSVLSSHSLLQPSLASSWEQSLFPRFLLQNIPMQLAGVF